MFSTNMTDLMYVGRSDRLADRLLEHGQPANGPESATFAFNLAYRQWHPDVDLTGSVKSQGALGVASSERGRGAARDLSALSI